MKKLLVLALVLAVVGGGIGYYLWNKPHDSVAQKSPDFTMTPEQLLADFQGDEAAANSKYLDKVIQLKGTIQEIVPGEGLEMQVILETGDMMSRISCVMEEDYQHFLERKLKKGDVVTLKGFCTGMTMDVVVDRCVIVE
jgi:tRNA_anti-like